MSSKYSNNFKKLFNFTRTFSELCGIDVTKKNYKMCWKTVLVFFLVNFALSFTVYTTYNEVILKGNWYNLLMSTSVIGTGIQGYAKLVNVLKQQTYFRFLHQEITEMYETYELKSLAYKNCLSRNISLVKKLLVTVFLILFIAIIGVIMVPVYMLIFRHTRVHILPFLLPFVDTKTDFGFYITNIVHIVCVFFGGFGNFVIDSWLFIYAAQVPLMKNILKCKLDELDKILEEYPRTLEKSKAPLNDIFKWHQRYMNFCNTIKRAYFWVIFIQVGCEFLGIVSTIVCIFLGIWPPAPTYLLYLSALFYFYCAVGNIVEVSNDDVITMIYSCCWYNLTVPEQKMILIMLREAQQATGISIGGVAPLSLSTALALTKTVYTITMMLMEFLD